MELDSDYLIHPHQVLANLPLKVIKVTLRCLFKSCLKISHSVENIQNVFLAGSETLVSLSLALDESVLFTHIEALLVEVTGGLIVVLAFKILGYLSVLFEALFSLTVAMEFLGIL